MLVTRAGFIVRTGAGPKLLNRPTQANRVGTALLTGWGERWGRLFPQPVNNAGEAIQALACP
jgi:hypothetical protein